MKIAKAAFPVFVALFAMSGAMPLWGVDTYKDYVWCGGGADNSWNTGANWTNGIKPYAWNYVIIPSGDWTIDVPSSVGSVGLRLEEGTGTVTLTGTGKVNFVEHGDSILQVPEGRTLVLDGASIVNLMGQIQSGDILMKKGDIKFLSGKSAKPAIFGNAKLHIIDGFFQVQDKNCLYVSNNAEVVIFEKGKYYAYEDFYNDESRLVIAGGEYNAGYEYYTIHQYANVDFLGGRAVWMRSEGNASSYITAGQFAKFYPRKGAEFIHPTSTSNAIEMPADCPFSGDIYVTNRANSASAVYTRTWNNTVGRRGTIYANRIYHRWNETTYDLEGLYIGGGGMTTDSGRTPKPSFVNGITLGAYEDLSLFTRSDGRSWTATFSGPLAFKTKNCFGETNEAGVVKAHSIRLGYMNTKKVTDLSVDGGGKVELSASASSDYGPEQLRSINIAANTTLAFTNSQMRLKAMNLRMGANSRLLIDISSGGYVDAAAVAEIGENAAIVVTALPATLTAGTLYPIYKGPAVKGDDSTAGMPAIVLPENVPEGWHLKYLAKCAYLTDDVVVPPSAGWTGEVNGYYTNVENWVGGTFPSSTENLSFANAVRTVVTNTTAGASSRTINNLLVGGKAPPYVFRGDDLSFFYPQPGSSGAWQVIYYSVRHDGPFPVVFDNSITNGNSQTSIRMLSLNQGSVSMLGDTDVSIPLDFGGDVRVGGNVKVSAVNCVPNYGDATAVRRSRLTVMPGASLTTTSQSGELWRSAYLAVASGGTMTVNGTEFLFTTNSNTHYVDGTLTVNAPFGATKAQTFRGDGTLRLMGGFLSSDKLVGGIALEGAMTLVSANWTSALPLSLKGDITIKAESNWTYGSETNIVLDVHSTLTLATEGHSMRFLSPIDTEGDVVVSGGGRLILGVPGSWIYSLSCEDGAVVDFSDAALDANIGEDGFAEMLTLRKKADASAFADNLVVKERYDVYTHTYKYSVSRKRGFVIIMR